MTVAPISGIHKITQCATCAEVAPKTPVSLTQIPGVIASSLAAAQNGITTASVLASNKALPSISGSAEIHA